MLLRCCLLILIITRPAIESRKAIYDEFGENDGDYRLIVIDSNRSSILVGGRERIYRLSMDRISNTKTKMFNSKSIKSRAEIAENCLVFSNRDLYQCANHIRLLLLRDDGLILACGTNSFEPIVYRLNADLSDEIPATFEPGYCSPNPNDRTVAIWSFFDPSRKNRDPSPYIGTMVGSSSATATVYRPPTTNRAFLTVPSTRIDWLSEPKFVTAIDQSDSVLFLIVEKSVEMWPLCAGTGASNGLRPYSCHQSRIIRVCKDDNGGSDFPLSNEWTTFRKARVVCTDSNVTESSAIFDYMVDAIKLKSPTSGRETIYAAFTMAVGKSHLSVICRYDLDKIHRVFDEGTLKSVDQRGIWHESATPSNSRCSKFSKGGKNQGGQEENRHVILNDVIEPMDGVVFRTDSQITRISSKHQSSEQNVLLIGTQEGKVIKAMIIGGGEISVVHEWQLPDPILSIALSTTNRFEKIYSRFAFVGTRNRIYQLSVADQCAGCSSRKICEIDSDCSWSQCEAVCVYTPKLKRSKSMKDCESADKAEKTIDLAKDPLNMVKLSCARGIEWRKDGQILDSENVIETNNKDLLITWGDSVTANKMKGKYTCHDELGKIVGTYELKNKTPHAAFVAPNTTSLGQCVDDKLFVVHYNQWCEQLEKYEQEYLRWQSMKEQKCELN